MQAGSIGKSSRNHKRRTIRERPASGALISRRAVPAWRFSRAVPRRHVLGPRAADAKGRARRGRRCTVRLLHPAWLYRCGAFDTIARIAPTLPSSRTGTRSSDRKPGATVFKRLRDRGYQVFAINPNADTVEVLRVVQYDIAGLSPRQAPTQPVPSEVRHF